MTSLSLGAILCTKCSELLPIPPCRKMLPPKSSKDVRFGVSLQRNFCSHTPTANAPIGTRSGGRRGNPASSYRSDLTEPEMSD